MPNTVSDFWRMIWEKKLPTIVMLTRAFEGKVWYCVFEVFKVLTHTHNLYHNDGSYRKNVRSIGQ